LRSLENRRWVLVFPTPVTTTHKRMEAQVREDTSRRQDADFWCVGRVAECEVLRQSLTDPVHQMLGTLGEHGPRIGFEIETTPFGRAGQRVERGGARGAIVSTSSRPSSR